MKFQEEPFCKRESKSHNLNSISIKYSQNNKYTFFLDLIIILSPLQFTKDFFPQKNPTRQ